MTVAKFRFVPAKSRVVVHGDLEVPAHFIRVINDRFDDGSIKRYVLQITPDGIRAGLTNVIYALVKDEGIMFKVDVREDEGVFIIDAAISSENDAARTVVIGHITHEEASATYEKCEAIKQY